MAKDFTKQHIVPKRYLDRFGIKEEKRTIIGTRIVVNGQPKFFPNSTENVGYIKNYYDVTDQGDPKYWEHFFAREIDTLCGDDMENIISKVTLSRRNAMVLSTHDKEVLSKVIISQLMRIPESVDYVKTQIYPRVSKRVKEDFASTLPKSMLDKYGEQLRSAEFSEQEKKEFILNHVFKPENFDRYCKVLQCNVWLVCVNTQRSIMHFVTSDNPVLVEDIRGTKTGLFHNGIAESTTCIFYPLSPAVAVAVYARDGIIGIIADKCDGRKIALNDNDIEYIADKNTKIIYQAYQHSFIPEPLFDALLSDEL